MSFMNDFINHAARRLSLVFDTISHCLVTIDNTHHEVHSEHAYYVKEVMDVPAGDVVEIRFWLSASAKKVHLQTFFTSETEIEWWFYKDVVINTAGTEFPVIPNRDHNSSNESIMTVDFIANTSIANANLDTSISEATQMSHGKTGSGRNNGGEGGSRHEQILKDEGVYCLRFLNLDGTSTRYIDGMMDWYEKEDADDNWWDVRTDPK